MVSEGCPTHEELLAFSLGRVSLETQAAISDHLRDCPACLEVLAELECEMDPLLSAVTRASLQPASSELLGDHAVYAHGLTRTMGLAGAGLPGRVEPEVFGPPKEASGERLGQYELLEELGRGGMGIVYRARHSRLEKIVAIKILYSSRLESDESVQRFHREMKAVGKLDHPCVVQATDAGLVDGAHYLAMEYVPGKNLSRKLQEENRLAAGKSAELIRDVARGLQHAHQRGLVHRDVKPSNILLDKKGRARITDFGLVLTDKDPSDDLAYAGTPAYMSPEQARGEGHRVDGRSDIFSLGAVFYRLLAGQQPFAGSGIRQLCDRIATADLTSPRSIDPKVPEELERICVKALAKDPVDRYATAGELADDLDAWLNRRDSLDRVAHASNTDSLRLTPRGLQCYESDDASFFLELASGPRDRSGLPEAIRFWKRRVEETEPGRTLRVGILRGPHGCGKTSLIRAGLLPNLAEHVTSVYVVATAKHTEAALTAKLRANFPSIADDLEVTEALAEVKCLVAEHPDAKILIVLDQFEQWLQVNRDVEASALADVVRLCDGQRVQCLLVVRDELWTSASRFMEATGVPPVEEENCTAVELLDLDRARSVLAAYGRACGALSRRGEDQTGEHIQFLDDAIEGLAENGGVSPLRLTMLAETVKDVFWNPTTLRQMGGVHGVGISFLDTIFNSSSSHRKHRAHRHAARSVLADLCPEPEETLLDGARTYGRLLDVSGYADNPQRFEELLGILNHRVRLISFVDPTGRSGQEHRCYRLSHEYLIPIVREWASPRKKRAPRGSAERLLEDCSARWAVQPDRRCLPTLWQWGRILLFARKAPWSQRQREMMRRATHFYAIWLGLVSAAAAAALLFLGGWIL